MRGFTLIETIIYIVLFGFIMSGVLLSVYGMFQSGDQFASKNSTADEGNFVLAKINWALGDLGTITSPASGYGNTLSITRSDGTQVDVRIVSGVIEMRVGGGGSYVPLTTSNVQVTNLGFIRLSGTPSGIEASTTINGVTFLTRRYLH